MYHSPVTSAARCERGAYAQLRPKLGQSYINDAVVSCTQRHLYGCSCPVRRVQLDKHARLRSLAIRVHGYDDGVLVRVV